ncbi:rhamnan synthesis F family protein [Methylocystis parvus]|uniref:rhamnosyltransferase WsaF family glycosyltransferase n=1 Tax=Methylocystis parvus TaxID=134 RepID=UPI003C724938
MRQETTFQAVRRHLRNGYVILATRGPVALYGAAMREAAKLIDSPVGVFLAPRDVLTDGPHFLKEHGLRATIGAILRQTAATYDPPLGRRRNPVNDPLRERAISYYYTYELTKPDGVVPSRRPANEMDFALEIPFAFDPAPAPKGPIAAIIHAFYPEILPLVLEKLDNIPGSVDLFLSTNTDEKRRAVEEATRDWAKGRVEIRVTPNRGRDIAAKFFGFRDVYENYDLFLHLHTKRSPHGGAELARWRDYLMDHLLGSPEIVRSILALFDDSKVGVVFPQHLFELRGILNWGYDYDLARALMKRMGVGIDKNMVLEFPSGSMFWGRSAAFRPLLDLDIGFEDFPEEGGHVDGTLAHAIERVLLMVAESNGFEWLKVARRDLYPMQNTLLTVNGPDDLPLHRLKVFQPCLGSVDNGLRPQDRGIVEIKPLLSYPSRNPRPRLNLLTPTVNPHQIFGGVATAMKLFTAVADALGEDYDRRIIATDADIEPEAYESLPDYEAVPHAASLDVGRRLLVDAYERDGSRLDLRAGDIFIATAWWTALFALDVERDRARLFGRELPFVYLVQDDEPYFHGRSSRYALAESTYRHGDRTIAVINSEELYEVMCGKYAFREAYCIPYAMNAQIFTALQPAPRERLLLVYGRPHVTRNAFELICDGLFRWQQRDPIRASRWRILFLGEEFPETLVYPVMNASVGGKVSLTDYASYLSCASVGVSLMLSPHPSYPPLEMAEAGLLTITNHFEGKNLTSRFDNIVSLDLLEPAALADAIESAVAAMEPRIGEVVPRATPRAPGLEGVQVFDVALFAERLRALRA